MKVSFGKQPLIVGCIGSAALLRRYPLRDVVGHQHIAPERKTDPGPFFDWLRYRLALADVAPDDAALLRFHPLDVAYTPKT